MEVAPRIRVLRVMDKLGYGDRLHGPGRMWLNSLGAFTRGRFDVIPCALRLHDAFRRQFADRGLTVRGLRKSRFALSTVDTLRRIIRDERIDLLHLHGFGATTFGRIAALSTGVPAVTHHHDLEFGPWYVQWLDRWLAPATAKAIAVSSAVAEACRVRRHLPPERIAVVPNAVDDRWLEPIDPSSTAALRRALGIPDRAPILGTVTRFHPVKDVPILIDALARLRASPPAHAVLVGDGPERSAIERRIAARGLGGRVHFAGFQADAKPYVALMDVAVVCSLHEGFSTALVEAMAMGRAVVATSVGGMRELVRDGWNGALVPAHDARALAAAIDRILETPGLATRMGAQARRDASRFVMSSHVAQIEAVYDEVLRMERAP